jgi:uncharacterized protein YeaO (DUF488 family)
LASWALSVPFTAQRWATFARRYRGEMQQPSAQHLLALVAALSAQTSISVGCYEDEKHCHRSLLKGC